MMKQLFLFGICFYAILFIFGIDKANGDDSLLNNQYRAIYNHTTELAKSCQDMQDIMAALANSKEFPIAETIAVKCSNTQQDLFSIMMMFKIYFAVYNNDDKSRISPIINHYLAYIANGIESNGQYINRVSTLSKNYNLVLTTGRLKSKIVEIHEEIKNIRFN